MNHAPQGAKPPTAVPTTTLAGTGVLTSHLGFGCAGLFAAPSARQRRSILEAALASGIRHFDVAPMYGLGVAERELGRFARGRREQVVIATKFGIAATGRARAIAAVQAPARRLLAAAPTLRRRARSSAAGPGSGRMGAVLYRATRFDATGARESLERSLRELGTDHVDVLLLHDPQPGDVRFDDLCGYLEEARAAGRIRAWGLAGEPEPTLRVARVLPVAPPVVQLRDDILRRQPADILAAAFPARITFGVLGASIRRLTDHVAADEQRRRRWGEAVGSDCGDPEIVAQLLLGLAARENADGVVLFSTTRVDHVHSAAAAFGPGGVADLHAFAQLVERELRGGGGVC
jgi:aryl-alcohol dehydrogenase-like predicted oxidoreductase